MDLFGWIRRVFAWDGTMTSGDPGCTSMFDATGSDHDQDADSIGSFSINPATGLPMMGNSMLDVAGNPFGTNLSDVSNFGQDHTFIGGGVNPASGLPLIDDSMIDVAGNPYGTDSLRDHSTFDHHHPDHESGKSSDWHSSGDW